MQWVLPVQAGLDEPLRDHAAVQLVQQQRVLRVAEVVLRHHRLVLMVVRRVLVVLDDHHPRATSVVFGHEFIFVAAKGIARGRGEVSLLQTDVAAVEGSLHAGEALLVQKLRFVFVPDHLQLVSAVAACGRSCADT